MPTSKKRIQVLLRPRLLELVETLAEEDGTATSAVCVRLIEEGLHARGYDVTSASKPSPRPSFVPEGSEWPEGWKAKTVSRNLKAEASEELSEKDMKLLEVLKMLKEI